MMASVGSRWATAAPSSSADQRLVRRRTDHPLVEIDALGAIEGLRRHQPVIGPVPRHQLRMGAGLGDPPVLQRYDAVRANYAGKPVSENQGRTALHEAIECFLDDAFALGIDRGQMPHPE